MSRTSSVAELSTQGESMPKRPRTTDTAKAKSLKECYTFRTQPAILPVQNATFVSPDKREIFAIVSGAVTPTQVLKYDEDIGPLWQFFKLEHMITAYSYSKGLYTTFACVCMPNKTTNELRLCMMPIKKTRAASIASKKARAIAKGADNLRIDDENGIYQCIVPTQVQEVESLHRPHILPVSRSPCADYMRHVPTPSAVYAQLNEEAATIAADHDAADSDRRISAALVRNSASRRVVFDPTSLCAACGTDMADEPEPANRISVSRPSSERFPWNMETIIHDSMTETLSIHLRTNVWYTCMIRAGVPGDLAVAEVKSGEQPAMTVVMFRRACAEITSWANETMWLGLAGITAPGVCTRTCIEDVSHIFKSVVGTFENCDETKTREQQYTAVSLILYARYSPEGRKTVDTFVNRMRMRLQTMEDKEARRIQDAQQQSPSPPQAMDISP
jgi:hypothetical protein